MWMLVNLMLSQGLLGNLHIIFPVFCSSALIFTILSFTSFIHSSALLILLLIPSSVLFISVCLQGKPFNITVIQVYAPTRNAEEAEVEQFYEEL